MTCTRKQSRRRGGGKRADQPLARKIHGQDAENRPPCDDPARSGEAVEAIRDRNPDGISLRELAGNGAGFRIAQMESHEADAVVARVVVLGKKRSRIAAGTAAATRSVVTRDRLCAIWMPSLTYTPGSRPPMTHSAAGDPKYIHAPATISAAGIAACQSGRGVAAPSRKLPRDASASTAASPILHHTSAGSEYTPIAASTNARVVVVATLMTTDQNRRSSTGSAARFARSATGSRKMIAPGSHPMADQVRDGG